ncbi:hypothetical protein EVAR_6099_1 [Eumeta japonica]|uniref:Uncharacterized protein n=1 Tax=Eumeta variegata TaxID=151549 RepID=A0A4C1TEZ2_EUMVA|nr:hypothetical protein EVAR_6099_1 [Eumeta japonica]
MIRSFGPKNFSVGALSLDGSGLLVVRDSPEKKPIRMERFLSHAFRLTHAASPNIFSARYRPNNVRAGITGQTINKPIDSGGS